MIRKFKLMRFSKSTRRARARARTSEILSLTQQYPRFSFSNDVIIAISVIRAREYRTLRDRLHSRDLTEFASPREWNILRGMCCTRRAQFPNLLLARVKPVLSTSCNSYFETNYPSLFTVCSQCSRKERKTLTSCVARSLKFKSLRA